MRPEIPVPSGAAPDAASGARSRPPRRATLVRAGVGLGVGALLVLAFLRLVDVDAVARQLEGLDPMLALLCGVAFLAAYVVRALRWRLFLAPTRIPAARIIGIYYIATFLNWLLPVQGGELAKCLVLRRTDGVPVSRGLATVATDKAMDLLPVLVVLTIVPVAQLQVGGGLWIFLAFPVVLLGVGALVLAFASYRRDRTVALLSSMVRAVLPSSIASRVEPFLVGFLDSLLVLVRRPRVFVVAAVYTAVAVVLDATFCYLAFRAVGGNPSFDVVLYGYTFYNLAYVFPTPPGHLGSNEVVGLLIFSGIFGMNRTVVGAMFVFSHPFTAVLMTASALVCIRAIGLDRRAVFGLRSAGGEGGLP